DAEPPTQAPLVNNLLATSTPTPPSANQQAGETEPQGDEADAEHEADPQAVPTQSAAPAADIDLNALMPTAAELPVQGLSSTGSGERTLSEVAATFGSAEASAEAEQYLTELGWSENVYIDFAGDATLLAPDATTVLTVSVHEFA